MRTFALIAAVCCAGLATACKHRDQVRVTDAAVVEPEIHEKRLLAFMHHKNQEEVAAGQLAQSRGGSEDVRRYGARLQHDHSENDLKLVALANQIGISLQNLEQTRDESMVRTDGAVPPPDPLGDLADLTGPDFDRAFIQKMRQGHAEAIKRIERDQNTVRDTRVTQFVLETLPTLHDHEAMAAELQPGAGR